MPALCSGCQHISGNAANHLTAIALVLLAVAFLGKLAPRWVASSPLTRHIPVNLRSLLHNGIGLVVFGVGAAIIMAILGIQSFPFLTAGTIALVLSLAVQNLMSNVVSGVYLTGKRKIMIGYTYEVAGFTGIISDLELTSVTMQTIKGDEISVPYIIFQNNPVVKLSATSIAALEEPLHAQA